MNNYTLTEIVSAKKMAWKLKLYSIAAEYRKIECEMLGITIGLGIDSYTRTFLHLNKPQGVYIDLTAFKKRFR